MAAASVRPMPGLARRFRRAAVAALPLLVWLGSLTWSRCLVFRDPVQLWTDTLAKNPSSWLAHSKVGNELANWGRLDEAIAHYRRVNPYYAEAHSNLGAALAAPGHPSEAREHLRAALRLNPKDAGARDALDRLGPDGDPRAGPRRPR
jgi:tetratricopeptide (TPR) repeat protein